MLPSITFWLTGSLTAACHLGPVVDRLAEHLKRSNKLFMDETAVPVLDPGRGRTKTGYLWALARDDRSWGGGDPLGVVFIYATDRAGETAERILQGFDGIPAAGWRHRLQPPDAAVPEYPCGESRLMRGAEVG